MSTIKRLERASGAFFFSGFMLSKLQYVPIPLVSIAFRFISLALYLGAYGLWFASNLLKPEQKQQENKWYGFAKIKEQFLFSSFIGFIATALSIGALFVPILFPIAVWLFLLGNIMWAIGEYHKLKNPLVDDKNFSYNRQKSYVSYAVITSTMSLVNALAVTLMIIFPPLIVPITLFSLLLSVGLGAFALRYWLDFNFGVYQPTPQLSSYFEIEEVLGSIDSQDHNLSPIPLHMKKPLFNDYTLSQTKKNKNTPLDRKSAIIEDGFPTPSPL